MKEYLLELAELKAKEIQTGLQEIKQTLKAAPGSLASYVEYVSKVQMCKARKDSLADQKKRKLEEMKGVLSKYRSKDEGYPNVPQTSLQSKIEGLGTELAEVAKLVEKAEVDVTEQREQNVEALEEKVVEEQERVRALIEKVGESETLIRADTPAKEALDEAAKIKRKFDESVKRLSQYKGYQETLSLGATPIPEVEQFENKFGVRHRLWQIRHQFGDMQKRWYHENFREQDAQQIVNTVRELSGELTKLKMKFKDSDEVLEAAQGEVGAVQKHSGLIAALGNRHMQEKHWVKVWSLVDGQPSGTLLNFTFNLLL
jgi:hypothetical protein